MSNYIHIKKIVNFIAVAICAIVINTYGQIDNQAPAKVAHMGISTHIGLDISRLMLSAIDPNYLGIDGLAMLRFGRIYGVAEAGWLQRMLRQNNYDIATQGLHLRVGVEKNVFLEAENKLFYGFRLAGSRGAYRAQNIQIDNSPIAAGPPIDTQEYQNLSAYWLEGVGGLQVEVVKHLSLGFTLRVKYKLHSSQWQSYPYNWIPGYGLAKNNTSLGLNYYVIYQFSASK